MIETGLTPELARVAGELDDARRHAHRLADVAADAWGTPPEPGAWSVAECLQHLNLTSEVYVPRLAKAIEDAPARPRHRRHRCDLVGWLLCRALEPPVRMRSKTKPRFEPREATPKDRVIADFDRLQGELVRLLPLADRVDLRAVKVPSPFLPRLRYNLYASLEILTAHQRRHLWQAERALERVARRG